MHADAVRIVVLTGYASIATAVRAIKLCADDYLAKPVTAAAVVAALARGASAATARMLKMHRRTLQRKLAKRPARD
jgi:two-component system response regulator RegA